MHVVMCVQMCIHLRIPVLCSMFKKKEHEYLHFHLQDHKAPPLARDNEAPPT